MRLVHLLALACTVGAAPAYATTAAFAVPCMNDVELAGVVGTGSGPGRFRDSATVNARVVEQQNGLLLIATFDNWFTDIGTPLIFANIAGNR